jgi:hypothetical protein
MANLITHKRSSVAAAVPAPGDLSLGEIALNTTDKILYIKDGSNNVVALNNSDNVVEGSTNLFFTNTRARNAISVVDNAGDGTMSYNSVTGVFTYSGISDAQVRSKISVDGDLSYNPSTGVITGDIPDDATIRGLFSATGDLSYNATTGEFSYTDTDRTDAQIRSLFSVAGDLTYNPVTGEFGYIKQTPSQLLTAIKTVDGDTSGLDSDLLDGNHGAHYLDYTNFTNTPQTDWNWSIVTTTANPAAGDAIACDTTGGGFNVNLPSSPSLGDTVLVVDAGRDTSTNIITVDGVANTIDGGGTTYNIVNDGTSVEFTYISASLGWVVREWV